MRKVCLVTGASGRLGAALCRALSDEYDSIAVYRNRIPSFPSNLVRPLEEIDVAARAYCVQADLTVDVDRRRVVEIAVARHGRVDAVVNCAADNRFHGKLLELSLANQSAEEQLLLNSIVPMALVSAVFQAAWKDDRDDNAALNRSVVNVSSVSGLHIYSNRGQAMFAASKAALNHLTRHLASELKPYAVRANAICPSRFPDTIPTEQVVEQIRKLLAGTRSGDVIELVDRSLATRRHRQ
jgi:NAD(P)-dependent dehydrogenase (short-subunit alcohol dehydrogenase family)